MKIIGFNLNFIRLIFNQKEAVCAYQQKNCMKAESMS
jgi:hypothetical protein